MKDKKRQLIKVRTFYPILALLILSLISFPLVKAFGDDLPAGPVVQIGAPTITTSGNDMTINANQSNKTWIDWTGGFNIGAQNSVNNIGPSAGAVILHNDVSGAISNIQGALNGNCNVFLLNPSGILFGAGAQVNVGGLVASTMRMSMDDFVSGNYILKQEGAHPGLIVNSGSLNADGQMGVTLAGGAVRNEGVISANLSTVNLVSGQEVTLSVNNEGSIQAVVDKKVLNNVYDQGGNKVEAGVENLNEISANGGRVYIQAEAAQGIFERLINQEGVVKAGSMVEKNGKIILVAESDGMVVNSGTLDASGIEAGAKGGAVHVLGEKVALLDNAKIDVSGDVGGGEVLVGGNFQGKGPEINAAKTFVGEDVTINADAINAGDGGKVIVWSDDATGFYGNISAKGGASSGDGGFAEVSGKENLAFAGLVDLSAPTGLTGTLLLDPTNITISSAANSANMVWGGGTFSDTVATPSNLNVTTLETQLGSASVIVTTASGLGGAGNIEVQNAISWNSANSLTLLANNNITINSGATITNNGTGSLLLNAVGTVDINAPISIKAGSFTSIGTDFDNTGGAISTINGLVYISNSGVVNIGGNINTAGALVLITGVSSAGASRITGSGVINTGGAWMKLISTDGIGSAATAINIVGGLNLFSAKTNTGGIYISNSGSGNMTVGAIYALFGVDVTSGDIELTNLAGNITNNAYIETDSGNITLFSSAGDIINDGYIRAFNGNVVLLSSAGNITNNLGISVAGANNFITLNATGSVGNYSNIYIYDDNSYLAIDAGSIIQNGDITTFGAGTEYVTLHATGAITDTSPISTDITTKTLNIIGATIIGASGGGNNALDTDVVTLNMSNVTGASYINEASAINLLSVVVAGALNLTVTTGTITATAVSVNNNDINLTATAGAITASSISAGSGAVTLTAATTLTDNGTISGNSVSMTGSGAINLNGNVNAVNGTALFNNAVTLTGNSIVSSTNGNITFSGDVSGANTLKADATNGTVTFSSTIGNVTHPTGLTINTDNLTLNNTVTVGGNINVNANSITLAGSSGTISTWAASSGSINLGTALIDGARPFLLSTDTGGNVVLGTIGSITPVTSFAVVCSSGVTTFNGSITVSGATTGINLTDADHMSLAADVTLTTIGASDISLNGGAVDGAYDLTVISGRDIITGGIGQSVPLNSISMIAAGDGVGDGITVVGNMKTTGNLILTSTNDNILILGGNLIGHDVSVTVTADDLRIIQVQDNTSGSTTLKAGGMLFVISDVSAFNNLTLESAAYVQGNLTAGDSLTLNGATTLNSAAQIFTSTNGDIDLNAVIDSTGGFNYGLTLIADNGTIYTQAIGTTQRVGALDLNADYAQLNGNIQATSVDTTGVGLTTLSAATVDIDTVGFTAINLGALTGANNLTISAGTVVTFIDATIASLLIDVATNVNFNGDFVTSGAINVTAATEIDVAVVGLANAGSNLTFTATAGSVDINGLVSATGIIDMNATANITVDANITGNGSQAINLTADSDLNNAGNLVIAASATATVATGADITLEGEDITVGVGGFVGKVETTGSGNINIRADNADSNTAGSFTLATTGSQIKAVNNINLTNAYEVSIGGTGMSAGGTIGISGVNDDVNISTVVETLFGGDITITAGQDVLFDNIAALVKTIDDGNITITAGGTDGILETVADVTVDISGYQVSLSALNGAIGQDLVPGSGLDAALEIDSRDWISATTATLNKDIWLAETVGAMYVNFITTGSDTAGTVTLEALDSSGTQINNGAIEDALIVSPQIVAGNLRLDAQRGIGVSDTLNTDVSVLAAQTNDYDIYLQNSRALGLTIGTVNGRVGVVVLDTPDHNDGDSINIRSDSPLIINDVVTNNDGGDITLAAEGVTAADDLTINADLTASGGAGSIYLYAGDYLRQSATADIIVASSGGIYYYAGIDYNNGTPQRGYATGASDVDMVAGSTATSGTGNITLIAPRNIGLSTLTTTGDVIVTADYSGYVYGDLNNGGIMDNNTGETVANITATKATLRAATGIGSADDIETNITTLDALNTTSGDINIYEITAGGNLNINQATQQTAGNINIQTQDGTLTVVAGQSGVATVGAGTITLISGDAVGPFDNDLVINDTVTSVNGKITLTSSGDDVIFSADGDVTSTSGEIEVNALSGAAGGAGKITMVDGTVLNAGSGIIDLNAYGDITLGSVQTTSASSTVGSEAVNISSTAGGIIDGGDTDVDIIANTVGSMVNLSAVTGIGSAATRYALETTIDSLTALNSTTGNIKINETDAINLTNVLNQAIGSIDVTAAGTITTTIVTAEHGAVNLNATAGDIIDVAGGLFTANATSSLRASGIIGTTSNPYDVNVNGELWVWAGSQQNEVSAILQGTVNSGAATERVEIFEPSPPGLVIFNNHLMGGGNYGSGSINDSILSRGYGDILLTLVDIYYLYYDKALHPWSYKMSLPWVLSQGAIVDFDFLKDSPATIDISALNINVTAPLQTGLAAPSVNPYIIGQVK